MGRKVGYPGRLPLDPLSGRCRGREMAKIPKPLSGWYLKELWGVDNQTLADYVLYHGLPAYDGVTRQPVNIEEELDHLNSFRNQPYGDFEQEAFPILRDRIVECAFKENEVIEFEKKHDLPVPGEQTEKSSQQESAKQEDMDIYGLRNIRNATFEFIDFCMKFNTICDQDKGGDTNPLSDKQTEFKKILEQQGPFTDPQISPLIDEAQSIVFNLQRQIERQTSPKMSGDQRLSIYDERYALVSRLVEIRKQVKWKFDKLIIEDKTTGQRPTEQPVKEAESQESVGLKKDECLENPAVIQLVKEAKQQIGIIHNAVVRNVGFSGRRDLKHADDLKREAIGTFIGNKNTLKYLKKEYLEDPNLYNNMLAASGHERKTFEGTLLQIIVKDQTGNKIAKDRLRSL